VNDTFSTSKMIIEAAKDLTGGSAKMIPKRVDRVELTAKEIMAKVSEHGIRLSEQEAMALAHEIETYNEQFVDFLATENLQKGVGAIQAKALAEEQLTIHQFMKSMNALKHS